MNVLEALRQKLAARQVDCEARYRKMIRQVADGEDIDANEAGEILQATGKTLDDLERAVAMLRDRRSWQDTLAKKPALEKELADVVGRIEKANAALAEAERKHREAVEPLTGLKLGLEAQLNRLPEIQQKLIETCLDPVMVEERRKLVTAIEATENRRSRAVFVQREATARAKGWRAEAARGGDDAPRREAKAAEFERDAEEAARTITEADAEIPRLKKKLAALEAKMLEP